MLSFDTGDTDLSQLFLVGFSYARAGDSSAAEFSDLPQDRDWVFY